MIHIRTHRAMALRVGLATFLSLLATPVASQAFPAKTIRIIAPFPPASVADVLARPIAQKMNETLGQPVIVDNRTGMAGSVGAEVVAKAPPDGYTLLLGTIGTNAINAALYSKMPYDVRTDFAPVTLVARTYLLLVMHPSVPVRTVKDVIALAKAHPGKLNFGSAGAGTTPHLAGEMFKFLTGVSMTHIAYRGSPQSAIDLLAGRLDLIFANGSAVLPHIRAGKMRLIAISAARRDPEMPDVPTIAETVPGFEMAPWSRGSTPRRCAYSRCRTSKRTMRTSA
jgi:tripartite-type tricarboxylate transporter receptor subunit TctC